MKQLRHKLIRVRSYQNPWSEHLANGLYHHRLPVPDGAVLRIVQEAETQSAKEVLVDGAFG